MADRTRNFVWGLATGYALTGANIIYTLVSVPLALHFLNREQFGLWVLVAQLASYLNMLDLGMQSSASRIFVNHKDHKQGGSYGSLVRTSFYVFGAQALGVLGLGFGFLPVLDRWMGFAPATSDSFQALMGWQILILAFGFSGRTFGCILHAHQKYTWANWGGAGGLILGLGALAAALSAGWGVFSLTAAGAVTAIFNTLLQLYGCVRLRLLPARGAWGTLQWPMAKNLFSFAKDTFLIALGWQLISASPAILISKLVGLEAAATWAVGTKLFMLFQQIVWKLYDFSTSGLAELFARGEHERMRYRFFQITSATTGVSAFFSGLLFLFNGSFISLWTAGKILWPEPYDVLLGMLLFSYSFNRCFGGLVGISMNVGFAKYIYLLDGLMFLICAYFAIPQFDFFGVLVPCLLLDLVLPGFYGLKRAGRVFNLGWQSSIAKTILPNLGYIVWVLLVCLLGGILRAGFDSWSGFIVAGLSFALLTLVVPLFIPLISPEFLRFLKNEPSPKFWSAFKKF